MSGEKLVLGYWTVRGLGAPIRYLLEYAGAKYEEVRYGSDGAPEWTDDKPSLGMEFPNLPYLFVKANDGNEDDLKLTQSMAVMRYIADRYGLSGVDERLPTCAATQRAVVSMLEQQAHDLRMGYIYYGLDLKDEIEWISPEGYIASLPRHLKPWSARLASREFVNGDRPCYVDFILFEALDIFNMLSPESVDPTLVAYHERMKNLTNVKEYLASDAHISWPVLGHHAQKWGYNKE